jgi:hypothetical protein
MNNTFIPNENNVQLPTDLVESYGLGVSKSTGLGYRFDGTSSVKCGQFQTVALTDNVIDGFIEEVNEEGDYYFDLLFEMFKGE